MWYCIDDVAPKQKNPKTISQHNVLSAVCVLEFKSVAVSQRRGAHLEYERLPVKIRFVVAHVHV
jgi:hypothetical protein